MIPRVCSFPRSGTHFLMAALAANFELGDLAVEATGAPGTVWYSDNKNPAIIPWGKLFLSHEPYSEKLGDPKSILYIARAPAEVGLSCLRAGLPFSIEQWDAHLYSYFEAEVYTITYRELLTSYDSALYRISRYFRLPLLHKPVVTVQQKVGWVPR